LSGFVSVCFLVFFVGVVADMAVDADADADAEVEAD